VSQGFGGPRSSSSCICITNHFFSLTDTAASASAILLQHCQAGSAWLHGVVLIELEQTKPLLLLPKCFVTWIWESGDCCLRVHTAVCPQIYSFLSVSVAQPERPLFQAGCLAKPRPLRLPPIIRLLVQNYVQATPGYTGFIGKAPQVLCLHPWCPR
jgi:hypothetical protein